MVAILQQATVKPPNIAHKKGVLNFMRNPKMAHIIVIEIKNRFLHHLEKDWRGGVRLLDCSPSPLLHQTTSHTRWDQISVFVAGKHPLG